MTPPTGASEQAPQSLRSALEELAAALHNTEADPDTLASVIAARFSSASSNQAKLLRVLKTINYMYSPKTPGNTSDANIEKVQNVHESFNFLSLWQRLGGCVSIIGDSTPEMEHSTLRLPCYCSSNGGLPADEFSVTKLVGNKKFVQLSANYHLNSSIKDRIEALLAGFYEIIPKDLITISPHLLRRYLHMILIHECRIVVLGCLYLFPHYAAGRLVSRSEDCVPGTPEGFEQPHVLRQTFRKSMGEYCRWHVSRFSCSSARGKRAGCSLPSVSTPFLQYSWNNPPEALDDPLRYALHYPTLKDVCTVDGKSIRALASNCERRTVFYNHLLHTVSYNDEGTLADRIDYVIVHPDLYSHVEASISHLPEVKDLIDVYRALARAAPSYGVIIGYNKKTLAPKSEEKKVDQIANEAYQADEDTDVSSNGGWSVPSTDPWKISTPDPEEEAIKWGQTSVEESTASLVSSRPDLPYSEIESFDLLPELNHLELSTINE
ncbi:hypothetical protein ONZ51_g2561 [Trametes cubensis]|uniref:Uncharacterized protein n=1 Tax=Trametes cubensis TaxID=1111947 RepID=A0AAD7U1U7_9APHY|nr:hypothetical protein ONZ51_g2561 [Trametes cubensis]